MMSICLLYRTVSRLATCIKNTETLPNAEEFAHIRSRTEIIMLVCLRMSAYRVFVNWDHHHSQRSFKTSVDFLCVVLVRFILGSCRCDTLCITRGIGCQQNFAHLSRPGTTYTLVKINQFRKYVCIHT